MQQHQQCQSVRDWFEVDPQLGLGQSGPISSACILQQLQNLQCSKGCLMGLENSSDLCTDKSLVIYCLNKLFVNYCWLFAFDFLNPWSWFRVSKPWRLECWFLPWSQSSSPASQCYTIYDKTDFIYIVSIDRLNLFQFFNISQPPCISCVFSGESLESSVYVSHVQDLRGRSYWHTWAQWQNVGNWEQCQL